MLARVKNKINSIVEAFTHITGILFVLGILIVIIPVIGLLMLFG
jgi:hypothetical protein